MYLLTAEGFQKLNHEDKAARPRMMNGRPVLVEGVPFIDQGLTQALGQAGWIQPEIGELEYTPGAIVALASDGIKDAYVPDFLRERGRAAGATEVLAFCDEMRRKDKKDDSTFVLIRLGEPEQAQRSRSRLETYAQGSPEERDLLLDSLATAEPQPVELLAACLSAEVNEGRALRLVERLEAAPIPLPIERWVALLDDAARTGRVRIARHLALAAARAKTRPPAGAKTAGRW